MHRPLIHQLLLSSFDLWLDGSQDSFILGWAMRFTFYRGLKYKVNGTLTWYITDDLSSLPSWLFIVLLSLLMCCMSWRQFFLYYDEKYCIHDRAFSQSAFQIGTEITEDSQYCMKQPWLEIRMVCKMLLREGSSTASTGRPNVCARPLHGYLLFRNNSSKKKYCHFFVSSVRVHELKILFRPWLCALPSKTNPSLSKLRNTVRVCLNL